MAQWTNKEDPQTLGVPTAKQNQTVTHLPKHTKCLLCECVNACGGQSSAHLSSAMRTTLCKKPL